MEKRREIPRLRRPILRLRSGQAIRFANGRRNRPAPLGPVKPSGTQKARMTGVGPAHVGAKAPTPQSTEQKRRRAAALQSRDQVPLGLNAPRCRASRHKASGVPTKRGKARRYDRADGTRLSAQAGVPVLPRAWGRMHGWPSLKNTSGNGGSTGRRSRPASPTL
jgi:hypothetical protein